MKAAFKQKLFEAMVRHLEEQRKGTHQAQSPVEKALLRALLQLRAEVAIVKTHYGSELHKATQHADRIIKKTLNRHKGE